MKYPLLFAFLFVGTNLAAQLENVRNYNYVYEDNIKSVKLHIDGLFTAFPVIELSGNQLYLSFDDLNEDLTDYYYTIIHCDKDWEPSNLSEMEYMSGFNRQLLRDYDFSFKTVATFTHYWMTIPNENTQLTKSGNYLLIIHKDDRDNTPIITRRFIISDKQVTIEPRMTRPAAVNKTRTHQELDFVVNHPSLDIKNPRMEVSVAILQNGRWDNSVTEQQPMFTKRGQLVYDLQDKIVFSAGKEFRNIDMRSLRYRSQQVNDIQEYKDGFDLILHRDRERLKLQYLTNEDLNGQFVIESVDENDVIANYQSLHYNLVSDYANVFFSLDSPVAGFDKDIYVVGEFTDWRARPAYKMVHNSAINAYVANIPLKQGYYNYAYASVDPQDKEMTIDMTPFEGNWHETENVYTIIVYYRPFGQRYDSIIGVTSLGSQN